VTGKTSGKATVYKNFINGEWVESHTGRTFENLNPADTRDVVGVFQRSDAEDVNRAIDAASEAYKKWRLVPAPSDAASSVMAGKGRRSYSISRH
jgi:aldehyde dehydrogenase (NAD+)